MYPAVNYARTLDDAAERVVEIAEALCKVAGGRTQPLRRLPWSLLEDLDAPRPIDTIIRGYADFVASFGEFPRPPVAALLGALRRAVDEFKAHATMWLQRVPDGEASPV